MGLLTFLHGFPQYCVSIALEKKREKLPRLLFTTLIGMILFTATKGQGAYLNQRRMRVSNKSKLKECILGTGFPFRDFRTFACIS